MGKNKMQYKDLIYKITSSSNNTVVTSEEMKKEIPDINPARKSVQLKDVLIGIIMNPETVLNKSIADILKKEIERKLTVLFNSPISDVFSFLSFDKTTLLSMLDLFPDKNHHYIATENEYKEIKDLKQEKLNLKMVYPTVEKNFDFVDKVDYVVLINIENMEPTMEAKLKEKNIMIFPLNFVDTKSYSQPEKLVKTDPTGWNYNSANGMWVKTWGWDGSQEIKGW